MADYVNKNYNYICMYVCIYIYMHTHLFTEGDDKYDDLATENGDLVIFHSRPFKSPEADLVPVVPSSWKTNGFSSHD